MLSEITNEKLIKLRVKAKDWEDAIRQSASVLVENNKATQPMLMLWLTQQNHLAHI